MHSAGQESKEYQVTSLAVSHPLQQAHASTGREADGILFPQQHHDHQSGNIFTKHRKN